MRRTRRFQLEEPNINLTPLIDVVFVILIMFIVVAPLLEIDQIELAAGPSVEKENTPSQERSPITIHVFADNTITYNKNYVTLKELESHLRVAKMEHPQARPQVFQDQKATFGTYQSIKNVVEEAGFPQMDVILKPQ